MSEFNKQFDLLRNSLIRPNLANFLTPFYKEPEVYVTKPINLELNELKLSKIINENLANLLLQELQKEHMNLLKIKLLHSTDFKNWKSEQFYKDCLGVRFIIFLMKT